jgi:hypothetical protein
MQTKYKNLSDRIEAENELFNSMTKAEQRVVIAQDCLLRIASKQIRPTKQKFFWNLDVLKDNHNDDSIKTVINSEEAPSCEVCAKGGLFLSVVGRVNQLKFSDINNSNELCSTSHEKLLEFFTAKQLAYIEYCFEGRQHLEYDEEKNEINFSMGERNNAYNFYSSFEYSEERLISICENIIKNKGEFVL